MFFFLSNKIEISCQSIWNLISLSSYFDRKIIRSSFIDSIFHYFFFFHNFFSITNFAFASLTNNFTLSLALITILLNLLIHPWTHLEHLNNTALSFTIFTFFYIFTTFPSAFFTTSCSFMRNFK